MANGIAKTMTNFAGDVWKGMSTGVDAGTSFRVRGGNKATQALKSMNKNKVKLSKPSNPNLKSNYTKDIRGRAKARVSRTSNATFSQKTGDFLGGGIRETYKNINDKDMSFGKALKEGHKVNGELSKSRVAGSFMVASAAGRIATGGGITKDKNGNTNIIGIPFI